ncbi:MAG: DUF4129 domain-containing protein [Verrucomicrobiota bacterium]|nr:DUF4129 domain-containing protein [Verrucomicrobiota bacterium]
MKWRQKGKGAFDLIEEAVHRLRTAPVATLAVYYLGSIPFVLGLLFFWTDMSRSPFANQHLADASLAMAVLFVWMKFWQAVFARRIRAQIAIQPPPALNLGRATRILLTQLILQPLGLFLIPLSLLPVLPFAWVYAFHQNATALADGEEGAAALFKKSCRQAALWPAQNNAALAVLLGFAFYVFLNWAAVCLALPQLFKMLFGIQSVFTRSPWGMLNTTFFAAMFGLTYLCVDPILKTFYALRCFYGESLQSGGDLKADLKQLLRSTQKIAAVFFIFSAIFLSAPVTAAAVPSSGSQNVPQISPQELDRAINQTIHERKYTWRMPREKIAETAASEGIIEKFFDNIGAMLRRWARAFLHWLDELLRKLFHRRHPVSYEPNTNWDWGESVQLLLWTLVVVVASALGVFLYRVWRNRHKSRTIVPTAAILPVPDIADEDVGADQLPEDGWTTLARELLARGEFRLAMRAFYLASLAHLAARNLIRIARFKSNRDYEHELRRRGHSLPELLPVFADNISAFERIWYGMHEVNSDMVNRFASNVERLKSAG